MLEFSGKGYTRYKLNDKISRLNWNFFSSYSKKFVTLLALQALWISSWHMYLLKLNNRNTRAMYEIT